VNPRIGSGLQHGRRVAEEETVEVVRNHEGGTRMGTGIPIPKGRRDGAGTLRTVPREWTPRLRTMKGRSLDNPKRGSPVNSRAARTGMRR
jgi:hypothetical protein